MSKLLFSLGLIMGGLALGYILQILSQKGVLRLPLPVPALRKLLQKVGLLFFMPISFVGAVWIIRIDDIRIITLPFLCLLALALGGLDTGWTFYAPYALRSGQNVSLAVMAAFVLGTSPVTSASTTWTRPYAARSESAPRNAAAFIFFGVRWA